MKIIKSYLNLLQKYPYFVQPFATAILFSFGDLICQYITIKKQLAQNQNSTNKPNIEINDVKLSSEINLKRTLIQSSYGFLAAPYSVLQQIKIIPKLFPDKSKYRLLKTMLYNYFILVPPMQFLYFSYVCYWLKGYVDKEYVFSRQYKAYTNGFFIWTPFLLYNFTYVRPERRVLTSNIFSIFWQVYMSFLSYHNV